MPRKHTPAPVYSDHLGVMLHRLGLLAIRDRLDSLLDEAVRKELNFRETLSYLCEVEVARRNKNRIEMGLKVAKFPYSRTLETFDFTAQPFAAAHAVGTLEERLLTYTKPKLLIIDELGYLPL